MGSLALNFLFLKMKKSRNRDCSRLGSTGKKITFGVSNPNRGFGILLQRLEIEVGDFCYREEDDQPRIHTEAPGIRGLILAAVMPASVHGSGQATLSGVHC